SANPTFPAYGADGNPFRDPNGTNPLRSLEIYDDNTRVNRVLGNISATLKISKALTFKTSIGIDNSSSTRDIQSLASNEPQQLGGLQIINGYNKNFLSES